jgi:hypothetical protein
MVLWKHELLLHAVERRKEIAADRYCPELRLSESLAFVLFLLMFI